MPLDWLVKVNGRTLEELGLTQLLPHELDWPEIQRERYAIPGRYGQVPATVGTGEPRILTLTLATLKASDITEQSAILDKATRAFAGAMLEIRFGAQQDRRWIGQVDAARIRPRWDSVAAFVGDAVLEIPVHFPEGTAESVDLATLGIDTVPAEILNLGTAPSAPLIVMRGIGQADPWVEVTDHAGQRRTRLELDGLIAVDHWWEIDAAAKRIVEGSNTSGHRAVVRVFGSGVYPIFDPAYGSERLRPLVKASHPCIAYYRGRWLR